MSLKKQQLGVTLLELLISMVIGVILLAGVITVYVNSNNAFHFASSLNTIVSDARVSLQIMKQDIQMAGSYGFLQDTGSIDTVGRVNTIATDCAVQAFADLANSVRVYNDRNPFAGTCIDAASGYVNNSDVLVVRYADTVEVADADISANTVYLRTTLNDGVIFANTVVATVSEARFGINAKNNQLQMVVYYISNYTDVPGDGYPSLHRIRLIAGPALQDEVIVPGVQDMQIQVGYDSTDDGSVNEYINADNADNDWSDMDKILALSINLVVVAEEQENGLNTGQTFNYADKQLVVANDSRLRRLVSSIIPISSIVQKVN